jgi:O-antigen/teichoic acid export membrane protein
VADSIKKLAGQTVVYGLGTIVPRLLNYLLTPFLTYGFSAAEFGINSELYAYISFLNVIFTYGMETTFFNFSTRSENKTRVYNTVIVSILSSTFFFSLLLLLFSGQIATALSTPNATYLPKFIVWCIFIMATDALMAVPFARLRAEQKPLKFSLLKLLNVVINFSLTVFLLYFCKKSYENGEDTFMAFIYDPRVGIGYAFLAGLIANFITLLFLIKYLIPEKNEFDAALLKQMLSYAWPLVILGLAGMVNETLDRIILKKLMPDKAAAQVALGIYGACYKIAILMSIFRQAFQFAAEPFFFGRAKEKDAPRTYALVMKYFIIFCLFIFLATMLNLEWLKYFIGENFHSGLRVVPILLVANICLGIVYNLSIWFKLSNQTRFGAIIAVTGAIITIVINVLFVPQYSYMACAWATLAAYAGMMLLSYFLGRKYYPISYNLRAIFVYTAVTFLLWCIAYFVGKLDNMAARLTLNNLLILVFVWMIYKMEIKTLKKISANVTGSQDH